MLNKWLRSVRYRWRVLNFVYGIHIQLIPEGLLERWGIFLKISLH